MSLISRTIANLFNGVSQQTPALRLPSQADEQVNLLSDPVFGLSKRPPTEHIKRILPGSLTRPKVHTVARDLQEKYQVLITDGDLKVFDLEGNERAVAFPAGKGYLTSTDPRSFIKTLTVQDYTFVANQEVIPQSALTAYLETDQVSCTVNFGEGELSQGVTQPEVGGIWRAYYKHPAAITSLNPYGWKTLPNPLIPASASDNLAEMLAALNENLGGNYGVPLITGEDLVVVSDSVGQPAAIPYASSATETWPYVRAGEHNIYMVLKRGAITLNYETMSGEPRTFLTPLIIEYSRSLGPEQNFETVTGASLWADVGYPKTPFKVPGAVYSKRVMPYFDGRLFVSVNGRVFSIGHNPDWAAEDYASFFQTQIAGTFPNLTVSVQDGWQLLISAPPGVDLLVGAWDSKNIGYARAVYSELPVKEAVFIVIKNGVQEQTYSVSLNGHIYSYTTGPSDQPGSYKVDTVANALAAAINAGGHGFQAAVYGNFIKVVRADNAPMTFASHDTWNDQAMYAMKNRVQAFEDLPGKFVPGHVIEVVGDGGTGGFYVHFTQKGAKQFKAYGLQRQVDDENNRKALGKVKIAGNTWNALEGEETGLWEECAKPGTPDVLIPATMPHVLVSEADGTFTFRPVDWFKREAGDADSVPTPSFVGTAIVDVFFHRNRLGFLTEETVVFSRASQFFNFWSQTARDVLDSDPIDVQVNHTKASALRHTAVFNNVLMLFSDTTQFIVSAAQLLTPKTVTIQPSTEFEVSSLCKPVTTGSEVHFVSQKAGWSSVWEYYVETNAVANAAVNVSAHVPKYLPERIWKMASSTAVDMLVATTDASPGNLYVYKYMWGGREEGKSQQSWSRWEIGAGVLNVDFVDSMVYLTLQRPDGVYLEKMDLTPKRVDGTLGWFVHMDRRVMLTREYTLADPTLEGVVTWTHFKTPYDLTGMQCVDLATGKTLEAVPTDAGWFKVRANTAQVVLGVVYPTLYRFSPVLMRDAQNNPIVGSNLQLKTWTVNFEDSIRFDVVVTPEKRQSWTHQYLPKKTGLMASINGVKAESGSYRVALGGSGEGTRIELRSDNHYPTHYTSVVWEGDYSVRSRRV